MQFWLNFIIYSGDTLTQTVKLALKQMPPPKWHQRDASSSKHVYSQKSSSKEVFFDFTFPNSVRKYWGKTSNLSFRYSDTRHFLYSPFSVEHLLTSLEESCTQNCKLGKKIFSFMVTFFFFRFISPNDSISILMHFFLIFIFQNAHFFAPML